MKTKNLSLVLIPLLTYFSASHSSQAVSPPPDGDYPGGNTAEGQNDLLSLTAGTYNTAVGWFSLQSNLTGGFNTANGTTALISNTTGFGNVATGFQANLRRKRSLTSSRFSRAANDLGYSKEAAMFSPGGFPFRQEFVSNQSYSDAGQLCIGGNSVFDLTGSTIPTIGTRQHALSIFLDTPSAFLAKRFAPERQ